MALPDVITINICFFRYKKQWLHCCHRYVEKKHIYI